MNETSDVSFSLKQTVHNQIGLSVCLVNTVTSYLHWMFLANRLPTWQGTRSEVKVHENNGVSATQHLDLACKVITDKMNEMAILKANSDKKDSLLASLSSKVKQLESKMDQQASTYEHRFQQLDDTLCRSTAPRHSDEPLRTRILSLERVSTTNDKNVKAIQCQLTEIHSEMQKLSQKANNGAALADSHDLRLLGLEMAGYNGVLVWKVHFEKAMADAKRNVKVRLVFVQ